MSVRPFLLLSLASACSVSSETPSSDAELESALSALAVYEADADSVALHLATFDTLDFDVFSNAQWDRVHESHADDVIVHWPDGRITTGLDVHLADLQNLFTWAPDTRIEVHPIAFGSGPWTVVTGVMEGTFTEPMPQGDGTFLEPTGLSYAIDMSTIGRWTDQGDMGEEWLFWDNADFYRQIGL